MLPRFLLSSVHVRFVFLLAGCGVWLNMAHAALDAPPTPPPGTFANPIHPNAADPFVTFQRGNYYLLCTDSANDPFENARPHRLTVRVAPSLGGLSTALPKTVFTTVENPKSTNPHNTFYESPELWHFGEHWYIYFTEYANTIHVLESTGDDPLGEYRDRGILNTNTYDATVLPLPDGRLYLVGSTYNSLVVQPLANPYTVGGPQREIAVKDQPWEETVIEAPTFLWHGEQLWMLYSCGGYNKENYGIGAMRFLGGDPADRAAWQKLPGPVFTQLPASKVWCAGAPCAFLSPDGKENWLAYSDYNAFDYGKHLGKGPRTIMAQPIHWRADGTPDLGQPIAPSTPIPLPSGDSGRPVTSHP